MPRTSTIGKNMESGSHVIPVSEPAHAEPTHPPHLNHDIQQPQIHIEERSMKLLDFLCETIKLGGSDLHLQALSVPMIRVDGRPHFLPCPPVTDAQIREYVDVLFRD